MHQRLHQFDKLDFFIFVIVARCCDSSFVIGLVQGVLIFVLIVSVLKHLDDLAAASFFDRSASLHIHVHVFYFGELSIGVGGVRQRILVLVFVVVLQHLCQKDGIRSFLTAGHRFEVIILDQGNHHSLIETLAARLNRFQLACETSDELAWVVIFLPI